MFICCSDNHFSEKTPVWRIEEDWASVGLRKFKQVLRKADELGCPVLIAGDFFDKSSHSPELRNRLIALFQKYQNVKVAIIPGNHDIKNHQLDCLVKSDIMTLSALPNVTVIDRVERVKVGFTEVDMIPFGCELKHYGGEVAVIHRFSWKEKPWLNASSEGNYKRIARLLDGYKLIIAGDNHEDFVAKYRDCTFLNCGGMLRERIDEQGRVPKFYVISERLDIDPIEYRVQDNVFDIAGEAAVKRKNRAIEEAAAVLSDDVKIEIDFKKNLEMALSQEGVSDEVKRIIRKAVQDAEERA